jgi:hypothetical protein
MLPLLRVIPIGGVLLAILILILALTPPDGTAPALHRTGLEARGPLIDRNEHPEWRDFMVQAAFRRAESVIHLFELPRTPTRLPEIDVPLPDFPGITIAPAAPRSAVARVTPAASEPKPVQVASLPPPLSIDLPLPALPEPTIRAALAPVMPVPQPADVPLPRNAKHKRPVPLPPFAPEALRRLAALPAHTTEPSPQEVTGSIDDAAGATIPVGIGEASSAELPIVLPPERPPVMRRPQPKAHQPAPAPRDLLGELFGTSQPPAAKKPPAARKPAPKKPAPQAAAPTASSDGAPRDLAAIPAYPQTDTGTAQR